MDILALLTICAVTLVAVSIAALMLTTRGHRRAQRRAQQLVRDILTPKELEQLALHGHLEVASRLYSGRVYRIPETPGIVRVSEYDVPMGRLCLVPARNVPDAELIVIHKLLLEGDETEYLARANYLWPRPPQARDAMPDDGSRAEVWISSMPGVLGQRW
jgi:hypothetical protein